MKKTFVANLFTIFLVVLASTPTAVGQTVQLLQAKRLMQSKKSTNAAAFTGSQALYANCAYVFIAGADGTLYVVQRNNLRVSAMLLSASPLNAVRGDENNNIYITSSDGNIYWLKSPPPWKVKKTSLGIGSLNNVYVDAAPNGGDVIVSLGQATMAADNTQIYLSALNSGEVALQLDKATLKQNAAFGQTPPPAFETQTINRGTGQVVSVIENPLNMYSNPSQASLYAANGMLALTTPGPAGTGVALYNTATMVSLTDLYLMYADCVTLMRAGQWAIVGTEDGKISVLNVANGAYLGGIDLRAVTGNAGIEVRSMWLDEPAGTLYAASSEGTFCVLQVQ